MGAKRFKTESEILSGKKKCVAYSGYVVPTTGELIVTKPGWFNYETVIQSLRDYICAYPTVDGHNIYMVLDNAPWHKKAVRLVQSEAWAEYADIRDKMELVSDANA
jgi:hypothetical protein